MFSVKGLILLVTSLTPMALASITCVEVGSTVTASWTNAAGQYCVFTGTVGSNFGTNAAGGDYSCNGRCGAGCTGTAIGNAYTQDCYSHDICSYFNNASGGPSDSNCGQAYINAIDDTLLGLIYGCGQTNPNIAPVSPSTQPTCT